MLARYYSMIARTDAQFAEVAAEFRRLGLWQDTVVAAISDHGDMMAAHGLRLKGTLPYDELYRVPFLLKPPRGESLRAGGGSTIWSPRCRWRARWPTWPGSRPTSPTGI